MKKYVSLAAYLALALVAAGATPVSAQQVAPPTWMPDVKFASGREIVPYFEGWIKNPDGSFDFVFGYFNRNTEQELVIPAGPENVVSPGPADQGQPTYFMARRQPRIFRVTVPKDWTPDKGLTWSITANGRTEKVVAKLNPAYEKDEHFIETNNNTSITMGEEDLNKAPTLDVLPITGATAGRPVTLTAMVTDDGLPKPRVRMDDPDRPQEQPPAQPDPLSRFKSQRNSSAPARLTGPRVTWQVFRGTGQVSLEQQVIAVTAGKAMTTATFTTPGTYTLIATAGDGKLNTFKRVTVDVK